MLLRVMAAGSFIVMIFAIYMAVTSGTPMMYGPTAVQGLVAYAVLLAIAEIVDNLKIIVENTKK